MCSAFRSLAVACALCATPLMPGSSHARDLRICADPNNLPFSNDKLEGFENKIVAILGQELAVTPTYTWWAQRRGFVRNTLKAGDCDLVPGVPSQMELLRTTAPYYRSSYVFVTRPDGPAIGSLDDPILAKLKLGVQLIGNDGINTPPAHALARRGYVTNVRGYAVYGDYRLPNPPAHIIDAVASGEIDVAVAWGPLAGYFAAAESPELRVTPVLPQTDGSALPMVFDISMGVRSDENKLKDEIDAALARRRGEIDAVLAFYHVPRVGLPQKSSPQ
jgi:mxaJ protein